MGMKRSLLEVDPLCLPLGMRVGPWRVVGWRGRGTYGTLYRVQRVGREALGSFALKLAVYPRDERFEREAWLLSHIHSPHVPRLYDHGVWVHPSGAYPYLVMELIDGEPLYDWSARRNPTSRQLLGVMAQAARALQATHEVGGLHRDVKGDNMLVRPADGRVFLTDFGAGHYRGAATLTTKLLPPGTPAYRSTEAWAFLRVFRRHPTAHYPASTSDDLFALGVTAYRLAADAYPPPTQPEEPGAEVWREGGPGPRPPRELNPSVSPELDALILRLLAIAPEVRFEGVTWKAVEAVERAMQGAGPPAEGRLFSWGDEHRPRWRSPGDVRHVEEQDAAARQELARRESQERARAEATSRQALRRARVSVWGTEVAVAFVGLLLAWLAVAGLYRAPEVAHGATEKDSREADVVAVGDGASATPATTLAPTSPENTRPRVARPLPEEAFPGQRKPPCNRAGEVEVRGACWYRLDLTPPCKEEGKEDAYEWKGACYTPSYPVGRAPTSDPP